MSGKKKSKRGHTRTSCHGNKMIWEMSEHVKEKELTRRGQLRKGATRGKWITGEEKERSILSKVCHCIKYDGGRWRWRSGDEKQIQNMRWQEKGDRIMRREDNSQSSRGNRGVKFKGNRRRAETWTLTGTVYNADICSPCVPVMKDLSYSGVMLGQIW